MRTLMIALLVIPVVVFYQKSLSESCNQIFSSGSRKIGNFSSPKFPSEYPSNADCQYVFRGEEFEAINITFLVFDLEPPYKTGCLTDYIDVFTITNQDVKQWLDRFCGRKVTSPLLSMYSTLEIAFRSNYAVQHLGFYGTYEFIDEKFVPPPTSTTQEQECGGTVTGVGGIITSPGYPNHFPANVDCVWLIRVQYSKHIYIRVLDLQLHGGIASCPKARLSVYDGYNGLSNVASKTLKNYCGDLKYYKNVDDRNTLSQRNRLVVRFTATEALRESNGENIGFRIVWTEVSFEEKEACTLFACENSEYCIEGQIGSVCKPTRLFCIDNSLLCNKIPNCSEGDLSDEDHCHPSNILGLACGVGIGAAILVFLLCIWKHKGNVRKSSSQTQSLAMQLNQLERSPSCSNRQLALSPIPSPHCPTVLEMNGTSSCPRHGVPPYPSQI